MRKQSKLKRDSKESSSKLKRLPKELTTSNGQHAPTNHPNDYLPYDRKNVCWSTSDKASESVLQESKSGLASYEHGIPPLTVPQLFDMAVQKHGNRPALRSEMIYEMLKPGEKPPPTLPLSKWHTWTWKEYYIEARKAAKGFIELGLHPHQSINIFGFNSVEWVMSAMGAILAGGQPAGIYPTDTEVQVRFKSDHSDGVVAVVEDLQKIEMFKSVADDLPLLNAIVCWGASQPELKDFNTRDGRTVKVLSWVDLLKLGDLVSDRKLESRISNQKPSHCATLIYTSGTTGNPKAVMLSHDSLIFNSHNAALQSGTNGMTRTEERSLSYLPLSHIAGMLLDIILPMACTSNIIFQCWATINFARSYDLKYGTLVDRLKAVRPTLFLGVPRVWEKIMEKLQAVGATTKGFKKALSAYARKQGSAYTSSRQLGENAVTPLGMPIAKFVFKQIKTKLGLDQCKFFFAGAAPMTLECLEFFGALGINVNEVYGMSESTAVVTWSTDRHHVWGSVGYELSGVEVRIISKENGAFATDSNDLFNPSEAEQGEVCSRGRNIMMGYMANPRLGPEHVADIEQKNAETIDKDGWLHSGDKGTRDGRGIFKITGRYKELIIGAGGENIAPVPIEDELKRLCPFVSNVMMVGNKRKFNVMVVTLKAKGATGELPGGDILAASAETVSVGVTKVSEAINDHTFVEKISEALRNTNANIAVVPSNAAKIQKFTILPRDFSVKTGELTPTLKLKRQVVDEIYEPIINKMYESKDVYVNYNLAPSDLDSTTESNEAENTEVRFEKNISFSMVKALEEAENDGGVVEDNEP